MEIIKRLLKDRPVLFDGSTGTELQRMGLPNGVTPEAWNLDHPEKVEQMAKDYVDAGAKVIETNTFGGNKIRLKAAGLADSFEEINIVGISIAHRVARSKAAVIASIGPLGTLIEPYGEVTQDEAKQCFREQARVIKKVGIEAVVIETMISLEEAVLAFEGVKEAGIEEIGVTMSYEVGQQGIRTAYGESIKDVVRKMEEMGVSFIGSNCGNGFENMLLVARELRESSSLPILVQPNAGVPVFNGKEIVHPGTPEQFGEFVASAISIGVDFVGGCCGTTPAHIREGKKILDRLKAN